MSEKYIRVEDVQDNSIAAGLCDGQGNLYGADIVFRLSDIDNPVPTHTPAEIMAGQWVPVTERLPEPLVNVLALYGDGRMDIDWVDHEWCFGYENLYDGVTHWMPLPEPPKEETIS